MGILRADRITGLGGANAIKGSVFFGTFGAATYGNQIEIQKDAELDIGNGNLTVECWFNSPYTSGYQSILGQEFYNNFTSNKVSFNFYLNNDGIYLWNRESGSAEQKFGATGLWKADTWNHLAWVREGTGSNENKIYVNGSLVGSAFTNNVTYSSEQKYHIGGNFYSQVAFGQYPFSGHISNLRMSNIARYTANFTPPTSEFVVDSNTIILTCQSPSNIFKEETGKTLSNNTVANNDPPIASKFTPNSPVGLSTTTDVGSQYGSTFDGFGSFATSTYMVPPGGNTRERNRGRGVSFGGDNNTTSILFVDIQSQGNGQDFGDLTQATNASPGACASSTRGLYAGGTSSPTPNTDTIGFITIANTANALDFGNLSQARRQLGGCSNDTRGLFGSGRVTDPVNTIDFITIATTGNASDFGDVTTAARYLGSTSSTTRGFWFGGNAPTATNVINFVTIATTGDASDFGDLTEAKPYPTGCSSSTRAISFGGMVSAPNYINTIEYFTMASTGNGVDFGDCTEPNGNSSGMSNKTRGVRFAGAVVSGSYTNSIDFINIATTGNASDFGDFITAGGDGAGTSDSHGGLS